MEPLTITIGIVAGAVANALAGPKRRYKVYPPVHVSLPR